MRTTTFHFLAQSAKRYIDYEAWGFAPNTTPIEHFVRTRTVPTRKLILALVEVYDKNTLIVKPPGAPEALEIRRAVEFMKDTFDTSIPKLSVRAHKEPTDKPRGRPKLSKIVDLTGLKHLVLKYNFKIRDLAMYAEMNNSTMSMFMAAPQPTTPWRQEQILSAAQTLFTGNAAALKELRAYEKGLEQ